MKDDALKLFSEIERRVGKIVGKERLIVIAGHPGSGKTTLATSMCLASIYHGSRCLYISFQEPREKLLEEVAGVGLELEQYEKAGLFKFIKLPVIADEASLNQVLNVLGKEIIEYSPGIVVVDSVIPLIKTVSSSIVARSHLQNYFYELQRIIKGPVVLVAELPFGQKALELGDLEFVSDVFLVLKHRVRRGLLERSMEIRKVRGHELTLAEIPFSIRPERGVVLLTPPLLSEISEVGEPIEIVCSALRKSMSRIPKSVSVYYEYPANYRPATPAICLGMLALHASGLQRPVLLVTYRYSKDSVKIAVERILEAITGSEAVAELVTKNLVIEPVNPYAYSLVELNALENELVDRYEPAMVIFHDVSVLMSSIRDLEWYMHLLQNQVFYFKKKGIAVMRMASRVNPLVSKLNKAVSDVVLEAKCVNKCTDYQLYVWGRFGNPVVLKSKEVDDCIRETAERVLNLRRA